MVAGKKCQQPWQVEHLGLRLSPSCCVCWSRTSTGLTRRRATQSGMILECVTACLFLISVGSFAYLCRPLGEVSVSSPGTDVVLEVVRVAANEQFPALRPALYPGSKATDILLLLCGGLLVTNKTPAVDGERFFFLSLVFGRERGHAPRRGTGPPIMGAARAECRPSRFRDSRDRATIQVSRPSMIHLTLGLTTHRTAGH